MLRNTSIAFECCVFHNENVPGEISKIRAIIPLKGLAWPFLVLIWGSIWDLLCRPASRGRWHEVCHGLGDKWSWLVELS